MSGYADIQEVWSKLLDLVEQEIPSATFEAWVKPMQPVSYNETQFIAKTGHSLAVSILKEHYFIFVSALKEIFKTEMNFTIIFDMELSVELKKKKSTLKKQREDSNLLELDKQAQQDKYEVLKKMNSECNLNLKYKFDNFVVGAGAKFAYAAAHSVAEAPGKKYNPLFIYGGSGLGKTHLMQAIGHHILYKFPNLKVKYVKSEEFLNELVAALTKGGDKGSLMNKFRQQYRDKDILLIDDIQFIAGKERMTEELFNTFETLYMKGKQIVLTSDRQPKDIEGLTDRLRSRFEMGLMADIQPPDLETRMAILLKLAELNTITMPMDVVEFVASVYSRNVRELEGAFNKITAHSSIYERDLTVDYVKEIINYSDEKKIVTSSSIIEEVAQYFSLKEEDIISVVRSQKISNARQIAMYLSKELTPESLTEIADTFKKKHSTILFAHKKITEEIAKNQKIKNMVDAIKNRLE